jgi:hypothetical protein
MLQGQLSGTFFGRDGKGDGYLDSSELTIFDFSYLASNGSSHQFNPGKAPLVVFHPNIFIGGGFLYRLGGSA